MCRPLKYVASWCLARICGYGCVTLCAVSEQIVYHLLLGAWATYVMVQLNGYTGLHGASERGHVAVVEALVDAGAYVNAANV